MASGLRTLHNIDKAIAKARANMNAATKLPKRASQALAEVSRKQAQSYADIAKHRLSLIEDGDGPQSLGYVDRQAIKLLKAHEKEEARIEAKVEASLKKITDIEARRREQETKVKHAVQAYEKAAETTRKALIASPEYISMLSAAETAEATTERARAKYELAEANVKEKGEPYRNDPYFRYLQKRKYGTRDAKGWFLTKWLDGWIARRGKYRDAALNYKRLTDIPKRLAAHVKDLEEKQKQARIALELMEKKALVDAGVTKLKDASLKAQAVLDKIDADLEKAENLHQDLRALQASINAGDSAPFREAIDLLVNTLKRKDLPSLRRIAAQTTTLDDDQAVTRILELSVDAEKLREDQESAKDLVHKYQKTLRELEDVRRRFKSRRYDAPSSQFPNGDLLGALLSQVLSGALRGNDFWRQIERAQRTVRRHSGDFGGIDWEEAMRLPRNSGGWGGGR
ncbi:MAG TPA: hypothetical protein ENJ42_00910, partial [Hellea balneolensis]|nr:hypothetical protein [Hellea balneolensis]